MADTPTSEQRIRALVKRGVLPSEAERIVAAVDARGGRLMTPEERNRAATVDAASIERARMWWWYSGAVPMWAKRLLDARLVDANGKLAVKPRLLFNPNHDEAGRFSEGSGGAAEAAKPFGERFRKLEGFDNKTGRFETETWGENQLKPVRSGMSFDEEMTISRYTQSGYERSNGYLRGKAELSEYDLKEVKDDIPRLDAVLNRSIVPEDVVVYRGAKLSKSTLKQFEPGSTFTDAGFISSTLTPTVAEKFAGEKGVIMEIGIPKGSHGLYIGVRGLTAFPTESEFLLPRSSTFKVVERSGNRIRVQLVS